MKVGLDREARRALLRQAEITRARLKEKPAAEAATGLAILIRDGLDALDRALATSTQVELGAATKHWLDFRRAVAPIVTEIAKKHGPTGVAFFLGWLKRLAALSPAAAHRTPSERASRRSAGIAASELKAGDVVEAVLLEERTRKGGWRASLPGTGLAGPIVNSEAVPSDRSPGDTVALIVSSVGRREVAFRYPDEPSDTGRR